jgi:ubiquinone/menaquinone biosynthesis C-methylase UbiE
MSDIIAKQIAEIEFWRDSRDECPESESIVNVVNKMSEARVFLDCVERHRDKLATEGRVLEIGAGQGWASCLYKKLFPDAHVTATDISEFAVMSVPKWEKLFSVHLDDAHACVSYQIDEPDNSIDWIFCFAAAHHFVAQKRTLREINRILKPGGAACYFYEPATPRYLYSLALRRVRKKRPEVPEDVLITSEMRKIAASVGIPVEIEYYPSTLCRRPIEGMYYYLLERIQPAQKLVPCTVNFIFTKPNVSPDTREMGVSL